MSKDCQSQHEGTTTGNILDSAFTRMNTDWDGYYTLKKKIHEVDIDNDKIFLESPIEEELLFTGKLLVRKKMPTNKYKSMTKIENPQFYSYYGNNWFSKKPKIGAKPNG